MAAAIEKLNIPKEKSFSGIYIALILFGMYVSFGMSWMGIVPVFQEVENALQIGHSQGTWLISVISLAKSIFPIVAGIIAARIGLQKTLKLSALLILCGLIVPWLPSYSGWLISRFLFGIGGAMWVTLMGAVTMQVFSEKQRPVINALNGVAINVGVIFSLWFTLPLTSVWGWQLTLSFYSILSGVFALMLWFANFPESSSQSSNSSKSQGYLSTLKLPVTWIISLAFTGPLALYLVFNTWLPIFYQEGMGISKIQTMQWMSWLNLGGIPAALATGFLLQAFKRCKVFIAAAAIMLPVVSFLAINGSNTAILPIMLTLTGVGMFLSVSPLITLLQSQPNMTPSLLGMILGTMFSVTYIISAMAPGLVGYFYDLGFNIQSLLTACCFIGVSPAIAMFLNENK